MKINGKELLKLTQIKYKISSSVKRACALQFLMFSDTNNHSTSTGTCILGVWIERWRMNMNYCIVPENGEV